MCACEWERGVASVHTVSFAEAGLSSASPEGRRDWTLRDERALAITGRVWDRVHLLRGFCGCWLRCSPDFLLWPKSNCITSKFWLIFESPISRDAHDVLVLKKKNPTTTSERSHGSARRIVGVNALSSRTITVLLRSTRFPPMVCQDVKMEVKVNFVPRQIEPRASLRARKKSTRGVFSWMFVFALGSSVIQIIYYKILSWCLLILERIELLAYNKKRPISTR